LLNIQPKTLRIGKKYVFVPTCHSTNDIALEIIQKNRNFDGTVIVADFQEKGRGQMGAVWKSEAGQNLIFSLALDTSYLNVEKKFFLSMLVALTVLQALLEKYGMRALIKWPNDIICENKKIGGILIENKINGKNLKASVIGIGLNFFQTNFEFETASSLRNL
jgi:BirA family transcriptional regulator, biotin operon repressor / biotin---[acetyl-CoA-carboxylase] ligase